MLNYIIQKCYNAVFKRMLKICGIKKSNIIIVNTSDFLDNLII